MDNIFKTFWEIYKVLGVMGLAAVILFGCILSIIYKIIEKILSIYIDRINLFKKISPEKSFVFQKLDLMIDHKLQRMRIACPLRKKIFHKILEIQFSVLKKKLKEIAKKQLDKMDNETYRNCWENAWVEIFSSYDQKFREAGIPEVAFNKFRDFNILNEKLIEKLIYQVCDSEVVFDSNSEKTVIIFNFIAAMSETALIAVEKSVDNLNGELSLVTFEGKGCYQCSPSCTFIAHKKNTE